MKSSRQQNPPIFTDKVRAVNLPAFAFWRNTAIVGTAAFVLIFAPFFLAWKAYSSGGDLIYVVYFTLSLLTVPFALRLQAANLLLSIKRRRSQP
ncbi:MAG: hypothetical protein NXI24_12370 [bacterium]|nr:hypothetical protein [bacterium]